MRSEERLPGKCLVVSFPFFFSGPYLSFTALYCILNEIAQVREAVLNSIFIITSSEKKKSIVFSLFYESNTFTLSFYYDNERPSAKKSPVFFTIYLFTFWGFPSATTSRKWMYIRRKKWPGRTKRRMSLICSLFNDRDFFPWPGIYKKTFHWRQRVWPGCGFSWGEVVW